MRSLPAQGAQLTYESCDVTLTGARWLTAVRSKKFHADLAKLTSRLINCLTAVIDTLQLAWRHEQLLSIKLFCHFGEFQFLWLVFIRILAKILFHVEEAQAKVYFCFQSSQNKNFNLAFWPTLVFAGQNMPLALNDTDCHCACTPRTLVLHILDRKWTKTPVPCQALLWIRTGMEITEKFCLFFRKSIEKICLSTIVFACPRLDQTYRLDKIGKI